MCNHLVCPKNKNFKGSVLDFLGLLSFDVESVINSSFSVSSSKQSMSSVLSFSDTSTLESDTESEEDLASSLDPLLLSSSYNVC